MGSGLPDAGYFNPHSPCGERPGSPKAGQASSNFNPHSPCGERPYPITDTLSQNRISIHTPLAGSDQQWKPETRKAYRFQSTLPLRGATGLPRDAYHLRRISIHTPLAGSDRIAGDVLVERLDISIHTPLAGSDRRCRAVCRLRRNFNPHSPCGERPAESGRLRGGLLISIHTPLAGSDPLSHTVTAIGSIFQSTLPLRGATWLSVEATPLFTFQSTLPLRGATAEMRHF